MAPPSLFDLCAKKLKDMEGFTKGREVTDEHWEKLYEKKFCGGEKAPPSLVDLCIKNLKNMKVSTKIVELAKTDQIQLPGKRDSPKSKGEEDEEEEANEEADILKSC